MFRPLIHYLCVFLLLVAQQGAIVHATWHAGGGTRAHESDIHGHGTEQRESPSGQRSLCALDLALGQVLGGVHGSCAPSVANALPAAIAIYKFNPRLGSDAVPAQSRGPPIFL